MSEAPAASSTVIGRLDALYEYDREPVQAKDCHGWKVFWATFAGEHIAGTEFVIGPLFVMHGCTATSVLLGLLIGNLLAVISWALICAPVAVRDRLTVYWQIRKIGGPWLSIAYSTVYGVTLCLLAGSMLRVSMTSLVLPFQYFLSSGTVVPQGIWIGLAVTVGSVIAILAILGFEGMAVFSKMSAPWMVVVFLISGIVCLPLLGCHSPLDFWRVANSRIWTGVTSPDPSTGQLFTRFTIWHVIGFSWLCNAPQHLGMADLTILRYARKWQMGFCSAVGMYLGHYCAWVASGILCAAAIMRGIATDPGPIAYLGAGLTGALCVVVAGWNVASPTLYRAGLALQVVTPNWQRWLVTLVVGMVMIVCACIPAILAHLDLLITCNALLLVPLGGFIFADFWIYPRLGLAPRYATLTQALVSLPAAVAWIVAMGGSLLAFSQGANPIFLVLPEWIASVVLYALLGLIQQRLAGVGADAAGARAEGRT